MCDVRPIPLYHRSSLQTCDVARLIKGRPLDNTEFMQWFKSFWDGVTQGQGIDDYDAPGRRAQGKTGPLKAAGGAAAGRGGAGAGTPAMHNSVGVVGVYLYLNPDPKPQT